MTYKNSAPTRGFWDWWLGGGGGVGHAPIRRG